MSIEGGWIIIYKDAKVQILPTLELYLNSNRALYPGETAKLALENKPPLWFILFVLFPGLWSNTNLFNYYITGNPGHVLILISVLSLLFSREIVKINHKYLLLLWFLLPLSLIFGESNPLNKYIFNLPGFSFFRLSGIYLGIAYLAYIIFCTNALQRLLESINRWNFIKVLIFSFVIILVTLFYYFRRSQCKNLSLCLIDYIFDKSILHPDILTLYFKDKEERICYLCSVFIYLCRPIIVFAWEINSLRLL